MADMDVPTPPPPQIVLAAPAAAPPRRDLARPAAVFLARLVAGSRPAMLDSLRRIVEAIQPGVAPEAFPWGALRYEHVQGIRAALMARPGRDGGPAAPATVNKHLAALRGVLREAWKLGMMTAEELERALSFDKVKGNSPQAGRMLTPGELRLLLDLNDGDDARSRRDAAILAVAIFGGLRRAEIGSLDVDSVEVDRLRVRGKGNKHREVPIAPAARERIDRWLEARGRAPGPLFVSMRKGERFRPEHGLSRLSPSGVWVIIAAAVERAALAHATPHDFRRTFVSLLLDKHDAKTVQDLAGHARVDTTMRYDRRGDERKVAAATTLAEIFQSMEHACDCGLTYTGPFDMRCPRCNAVNTVKRESRDAGRLTLARVKQANARAVAAGAPGTLTLTSWMRTVQDFKGLCAYCGTAPFEVIEHATPIPRGGTTAQNCLPACTACNNNKGTQTLSEWARTPKHREALIYLATKKGT